MCEIFLVYIEFVNIVLYQEGRTRHDEKMAMHHMRVYPHRGYAARTMSGLQDACVNEARGAVCGG